MKGLERGNSLKLLLALGGADRLVLGLHIEMGGGVNGYILTNLQKCALIRWITQSFVNNQLLIIVYFGEFKAG